MPTFQIFIFPFQHPKSFKFGLPDSHVCCHLFYNGRMVNIPFYPREKWMRIDLPSSTPLLCHSLSLVTLSQCLTHTFTLSLFSLSLYLPNFYHLHRTLAVNQNDGFFRNDAVNFECTRGRDSCWLGASQKKGKQIEDLNFESCWVCEFSEREIGLEKKWIKWKRNELGVREIERERGERNFGHLNSIIQYLKLKKEYSKI